MSTLQQPRRSPPLAWPSPSSRPATAPSAPLRSGSRPTSARSGRPSRLPARSTRPPRWSRVCASAAERNWSVYGQIKNEKRYVLSHATGDKLVYLLPRGVPPQGQAAEGGLRGQDSQVGLRLRLGRERRRKGPDAVGAGVLRRAASEARGRGRRKGTGRVTCGDVMWVVIPPGRIGLSF